MIRLVFLSLFFLLLTSVELGFISALPFPLDRTPLVLVVSVFAFQSLDIRQSAWWVVLHGLLLDMIHVSFVPLEVVSYTLSAIVLVLASRHVFSNRSFWGVLGTLTLSMVALTCVEIAFSVGKVLFGEYPLSLQELLSVRTWGWALGMVVLLFLYPLCGCIFRLRSTVVVSTSRL